MTDSASIPKRSGGAGWPLAALLFVTAVMLFARWTVRPPVLEPEVVTAHWTTAAEREAARLSTRERIINAGLDLPLSAADDRRWESFLSAVKWQADSRPEVREAVRRRLTLPPLSPEARERRIETQRLALETAFALFPTGLEPEMREIFLKDGDAKRVAMAGAWLVRADGSGASRDALRRTLEQRFPDWAAEPRLLGLMRELTQPRAGMAARRPPLRDLFRAPFDGRPVVFSLQRADRRYAGRAVIRHADGAFLVEPDGRPFSIPQLALSASGLPGTLTNGNTPCGVFEITEFSHSRSRSIGPSETIVLGLPLEYDKSWTEARYEGLLPPSWRAWWPIREAWWAGQAGRFEILAHGTAKDPSIWADTIFAGWTPSHGCLTGNETWDPGTGRRAASDQALLTAALRRAGPLPGYLVVVEVDAQEHPVSTEEVAALLRHER